MGMTVQHSYEVFSAFTSTEMPCKGNEAHGSPTSMLFWQTGYGTKRMANGKYVIS